jgi:hypothetical protein
LLLSLALLSHLLLGLLPLLLPLLSHLLLLLLLNRLHIWWWWWWVGTGAILNPPLFECVRRLVVGSHL